MRYKCNNCDKEFEYDTDKDEDYISNILYCSIECSIKKTYSLLKNQEISNE